MSKRTAAALDGLKVDAIVSSSGVQSGRLDDEIQIQMLGSGQEVGRSCCLIKYRGRTIICDTGSHPGLPGISALPYFDEVDWIAVDAILVTHFHIDHAAALPYVMEKTNFKEGIGKVYMTRATKAIYNFLMRDFVKISLNTDDDDVPQEKLYDEEELRRSFDAIEAINFLEEVTVPHTAGTSSSVRFTSYHAGHVLGAAMFLIEIAGARILYTGDYSTEHDHHLMTAQEPNWGRPPDVMICESTFGVQNHQPREEKEELFLATIANILKRGGKVLMPVFAVGNVQELLLILDEHWRTRPDLQQYQIYIIGNLASRCMSVYRQHSNSLNASVQARVARGDNPFDFRKSGFIRELKGISRKDRFDDSKPCIVLASPGMLQSGISRELLEKWAPDPKNGLMLCGYSVEGTLARDMQNEPREFEALLGKKKIIRRMTVHYISFAAHVDYQQNSTFIDQVKPTHLILVHGSRDNMFRLRDALKAKYKEKQQDVQVYTPSNVRDKVKIQLSGSRIAKAIGSLANKIPANGSSFSGLLLAKDGSYTLLAPSDLQEFTGLSTTTILQRQKITLDVGWDLVQWHLEGMYGSVELGKDPAGLPTMRVMRAVDVKQSGDREMTIEWMGGSTNDMVADSVLALLMGIETSPASVKSKRSRSASPDYTENRRFSSETMHLHKHSHADHAESYSNTISEDPKHATYIDRVIVFLRSHFGRVDYISAEQTAAETLALLEDEEEKKPKVEDMSIKEEDGSGFDENRTDSSSLPGAIIRVRLDDHVADIHLDDLSVHSKLDSLQQRVESVLQVAFRTITPLAPLHSASKWQRTQTAKRVAVKEEV